MPNEMTVAVKMGKKGWLNEEGIKLVGGCWVVDDWMEEERIAVGVAWFTIHGMRAWKAKGDGLMPDDMTGAVNMGRELLTLVGVDVLFKTIKINTEDQHPTCLAACSDGPISLPSGGKFSICCVILVIRFISWFCSSGLTCGCRAVAKSLCKRACTVLASLTN